MIETNAISSGTRARNEAKTKVSTTSAPRPPISASSRTPGPLAVGAAVLGQRVEAGQVHRPARRPSAPSSARLAAFSACGFSPKSDVGSGCG